MPGRKPFADQPVEWKISLPGSLAAKVELILLDPAALRAGYGKRSALICMLLREWITKFEKEKPSVTDN